MSIATIPTPPVSEKPSKDDYQAGMTEDGHLLSGDQTSKDTKSLSYGPRKTIGLAALLPLVTVLFWSFGMGSALLIWFLVKRISPIPGVRPSLFNGFIVVNEGNQTGSTENINGQEGLESTMRGVLIITAISHFSSMAVVPLMALGAFYVAAQWLDDQSSSKDGPTPLQFGLILQMCSSGTWDSVLTTLKYLFRRWRIKSRAPARVSFTVYKALLIASVVVLLHYAVIATDLGLTSKVGSAYYTAAVGVDIPSSDPASVLATQYDTSLNPQQYWTSFMKVLGSVGADVVDTEDLSGDYYHEGLDTMNSRSTKHHISLINNSVSIALQDSSFLAIIARPPYRVPYQWSWNASTIGMRARCQPTDCNLGNATTLADDTECPIPTGTYRPIPRPAFPFPPPVATARSPRFAKYDPTTGEMLPQVTPNAELMQRNTNPSYILMNFQMYGSTWDTRSDTSEVGKIYQPADGLMHPFYIGICEITLYDVEVSFIGTPARNGNKDVSSQYTLASPPVPMSGDKSALILSPIRARFSSDRVSILDAIIQLVGSFVVVDTISPGFSNRVSEEFARLYLGFISSMVRPIPANRVREISAKLVSRYPLTGTMSYIAVVYAHGFLAIILFVGIIGRSSSTVVVDDPGWQVNWRGVPVRREKKPVQELLLVHSRLTDPLAVVAEHFSEPGSDDKDRSMKRLDRSSLDASTSVGTLSARKDPIEMFGEESGDTMRVEVGLQDDRESGRRFGLNHRKARLVEKPETP